MFGSQKLYECEKALNMANHENLELKAKVEKLEKALTAEAEAKRIEQQKANLESEILTKYKDLTTKSEKLVLENAIKEATKAQTEEIAALKATNAATAAENSVLKEAFKNLGFDVKDMKGILDKLVDGLIAKNTIQVVK